MTDGISQNPARMTDGISQPLNPAIWGEYTFPPKTQTPEEMISSTTQAIGEVVTKSFESLREAPAHIAAYIKEIKLIPSKESDKAVLILFTRTCTWIQGATHNALALLSVGLKGTVGFLASFSAGSFFAVSAYVYVVGANFYQGVVSAAAGQKWDAAKHFLSSFGAATGLVVALNTALTGIQHLWHVAGPFLVSAAGTIAGAALIGVGPIVSAVLDTVKAHRQTKDIAIFKQMVLTLESTELDSVDGLTLQEKLRTVALSHPDKEASTKLQDLINNPNTNILDLQKLRQNLIDHASARTKELKHHRMMTALKIVGAVAFAVFQIILAIGTGGISVGVMAAIFAGYLLVSHIADIIASRASRKNLEVFLEQITPKTVVPNPYLAGAL